MHMGEFAQAGFATRLAIQNVPRRMGMSSVVVLGIAGTVAVLVSMLGMASSLLHMATEAGARDRVIVMRAGAGSEMRSSIDPETVAFIAGAPGIRRDADGKPLSSAESLAILPAFERSGGNAANVTLRGLGAQGLAIRPQIKITAGRMFRAGLNEVVVGLAARSQFRGFDLGAMVRDRYGTGEWTIVGEFSSGDPREAELLADAGSVLSAYKRNQYQSVTALLAGADSFAILRAALAAHTGVALDVERESDYMAQRTKALAHTLSLVGWLISAIMAAGATFAVVNAMYLAVSTRSRELATLGAIGFRPRALVISVLCEVLLLAIIGSALGVGLAWLLFEGGSVTASGTGDPVPLVYRLRISAPLILLGVGLACAAGLLGALFPAVRVGRMRAAEALRGA
jgi:putative ABC transport system permease protein